MRLLGYGEDEPPHDEPRSRPGRGRRGRARIRARPARAASRPRRAGPRAAAASWLAVRPGRPVLRPVEAQWLTVASQPAASVEPGDHDALDPADDAAVALAVWRSGCGWGVVIVRAPGCVSVRSPPRLAFDAFRSRTALELVLGEPRQRDGGVDAGRVRLLRSCARVVARRCGPKPRDLRPRTHGVVEFRYRGRLAGWVTARVRLNPSSPGRPVISRTFRVKL